MDQDDIAKCVCAVGDASEKSNPPKLWNLQGDGRNYWQVDEPDQRRSPEVKEEMKSLLVVLMVHGITESSQETQHHNYSEDQHDHSRNSLKTKM